MPEKEVKEMSAIQNLDNSPLLANQYTLSHQAEKFVLDFKGLFPQFTHDNKPQLIINHKTVLLEPYAAKEFLKTMQDNIKKYEEKFGKIKVPQHVKKARKKTKDRKKSKDKGRKPAEGVSAAGRPSYMG